MRNSEIVEDSVSKDSLKHQRHTGTSHQQSLWLWHQGPFWAKAPSTHEFHSSAESGWALEAKARLSLLHKQLQILYYHKHTYSKVGLIKTVYTCRQEWVGVKILYHLIAPVFTANEQSCNDLAGTSLVALLKEERKQISVRYIYWLSHGNANKIHVDC